MRHIWKLSLCFLLGAGLMASCQSSENKVEVPGKEGAVKSSASARAERRAYDGAPPVIPHADLGATCLSCHTPDGISVPELGFAPAMPHKATSGMSDISRCRQCHVFETTDATFVNSSFAGLRQDMRLGDRFADGSPPVIPHKVFMRENCAACHTGPGAREEIRTSHPERERCVQCHVPQGTTEEFVR